MAAAALVTSISGAVTGVFGFLSKGKEVKIEQQKTEQLKLQIEATEDVEMQKTLQKKLDVQVTQLNAAIEADRLRRIGNIAATFGIFGLIALVVVQVFKYKTKKDIQQPIIIQ